MEFSEDDLSTCLRVLQQVADDPALMQGHARFKSLITKIHRAGKKGARRAASQQQRADDRALRASTAIMRGQRSGAELTAGSALIGTLHGPQPCYICKQPYAQVHAFYHMLCPACAALNYRKRLQRADLTGRVALVTGGRIKIGHQTALRLLRDGARVIVTTRFPHDAARRFAAADDFQDWHHRLLIYGLDLRHIPAVEAFVRHVYATEPALDILINNAAQTVKRPLEFYQHLLAQEQQPAAALPAHLRALLPAAPAPSLPMDARPDDLGDLPDLSHYFPPGVCGPDGQPLDLRASNSWVLRLDQVSTLELLEVQLVNAIAPFVLTAQLKPLLRRSPHARRFIINVSAMEGQFTRAAKTVYHPHTNMAKAALNMLTRTSAADYIRDGIAMNSVDTGWITDENPYPKHVRVQAEHGFTPPLDVIDGAARIYDPIAQGVTSTAEPVYGQFLKDYRPYPW